MKYFVIRILKLALITFFGFSAHASTYSEENVTNYINDCPSAKSHIKIFCTGNPDYDEKMANRGAWSRISESIKGGGQSEEEARTRMQSLSLSLNEIKAACAKAQQTCDEYCKADEKRYYEMAHSTQPPNQGHLTKHEESKNTRKMCAQERQTFETKEAAAQADIAEILAGIAAIAQALGLGNGSNDTQLASLDDEETDECEGPYAEFKIECKGQSDPKGTRAGLTGVASLNGKPVSGLNLPGADTAGLPGGEKKDNNGGSGSSNGFGAAGFGGLGSAGGAGGGSGSEGGKEGSGLDTDIHKGTYGVGGGFSGGGGSGGGGGGKPFYGGSGSGYKPASIGGKAALNKKLSKLKSQARMPASKGGANGPFEDNWTVVNKAYKKNSSSMFHQQ